MKKNMKFWPLFLALMMTALPLQGFAANSNYVQLPDTAVVAILESNEELSIDEIRTKSTKVKTEVLQASDPALRNTSSVLVSEIYEYDQVLSRVQLADGTEVTRRAKTVIEEIQPRYNSETTKSKNDGYYTHYITFYYNETTNGYATYYTLESLKLSRSRTQNGGDMVSGTLTAYSLAESPKTTVSTVPMGTAGFYMNCPGHPPVIVTFGVISGTLDYVLNINGVNYTRQWQTYLLHNS